jgi:ATP-dependent RNA helicase DOB1
MVEYKQELRKIAHQPQKILPFLNIGRIVHLVDGNIDWGYGISINFHKKEGPRKARGEAAEPIYLVDCLVYIKPRDKNQQPTPTTSYKEEGELVVLTFSLHCILEVASLKISNMPNDLHTDSAKNLILKTMQNITSKKIATLPLDSNEPEAVTLKLKVAKAEE